MKETKKKQARVSSKKPVKKRVKPSVKKPVKKQAKASSKKSVKKRAKPSAKKPVKKQAKASVKKPVKKRAKPSAKKLVKKQAKASVKKSVKKRAKSAGIAEKPAKKHSGFGKKFQFIMKDVRCFAGEQVFEIRPLTFLTGENSTGKTTVLGCLSAIHNLIQESGLTHKPHEAVDRFFYNSTLDLNRMPYSMGLFDEVARKRPILRQARTQKQKTTFSLGFQTGMEGSPEHTEQIKYMFDFVDSQKKNAPVMDHIGIYFKDLSFHLDKEFDKDSFEYHSKNAEAFESFFHSYRIKYKNKVFSIASSGLTANYGDSSSLKKDAHYGKIPEFLTPYDGSPPGDLFDLLFGSVTHRFFCNYHIDEYDPSSHCSWYEKTDPRKIYDKDQELLLKNVMRSNWHSYRANRQSFMEIFKNSLISLAPVRSKPRRTYEPIGKDPDPEGSETPVALLRLSDKAKDWKTRKKLIDFGKSSGMFSDIEIKKSGTEIGSSFQLKFKIKGVSSNIMNIGYGVSQTLPLLVRLFSGSSDTKAPERFLLQQPEMHLHPKAQAALSSLFIESVKTMNKSFLIETHSDYMVDRACIEIRKGNIPPDYVSLIYLESLKDGSVRAHNISFDKEGNMKNVPPGYRDFFLKETDEFLGVKD